MDRELVDLALRKREDAMKKLREIKRDIARLNLLIGKERIPARPVRDMSGFKVADAIGEILGEGAKAMSKDDLVKALVGMGLWPGESAKVASENAQRSITQGITHKYLTVKGGKVHYTPGVRKPRVKRKSDA